MTVTMEDVARRAVVSVATVSRVINNPEMVNKETRDRVLEAIAALDYRMNTAARSLRTQKTRHLAVLLPNLSDPRLIEALETVALEEGFTTLLCTTQDDPARTRHYLTMLAQQRRVDGLIWISPEAPPDQIEQFRSSGLPLVLVNHKSQPHLPILNYKYQAAAYRATVHLLELGHRRIALLNCTGKYCPSSQWWQDGYKDAFADFFLDVDRQLIYNAKTTWNAAVDAIFQQAERPTAVIAFDDWAAAQVYEKCRLQGLRIPADLSLVGCGDLPFAAYLSLSTLRFPVQKIARRAVNLLLHAIEPEARPLALEPTMEPELVLRGSTIGLRSDGHLP